MGLQKPTADDERIQTADQSLFYGTAAFVCCWVNFDNITPAIQTVIRTFSGDLGLILRKSTADVQFFYHGTGGNHSKLHTPTTALANGVWRFWFGGVDASGNNVVGIDDEETTATDSAFETTGSNVNPTIGAHESGTGGHELLGHMADFRYYSRLLSLEERRIIYHAQGKDGIIDGLVCRLLLTDDAPGVDTDTTLPVDLASPGRSWVSAGTGNAYVWQPSPYPTRRRTF